MALFLQYKAEGFQWAVWKMDETVEELLPLLPNTRRALCEQELQGFISEKRKKEWLSVRVLLFTILKEDKEIRYSPGGKPFLADGSAFISISHTKGYVAVILGYGTPVGIDIEQYAQRVHRVADRFLRSDEEVNLYKEDSTWSLLLHWSAKEAIYKCMEEPDADLRKIRLMPFVPQEMGSFKAQEYGTEGQQCFTVGYRLCSDFVLTWTLSMTQKLPTSNDLTT